MTDIHHDRLQTPPAAVDHIHKSVLTARSGGATPGKGHGKKTSCAVVLRQNEFVPLKTDPYICYMISVGSIGSYAAVNNSVV